MASNNNQHIKGSATIWGATILLALAIIGVAVYVAMGQQTSPPQQVVVQKAQQEPVLVAPPPEVVRPEPEQRPQTETLPETRAASMPRIVPPAPAQEEETGPVKLQLDNLAGTLVVELPFMKLRNKIPLDHTCYRRNESPAINWSGAPPGTQSYVVFMERRTGNDDPEAPFVNWLLYNVPVDLSGLAQAQAQPNGAAHAVSDHNNIGYIGPCEPKGKFTYAIRVFALDTVLDTKAGAGKYDLIRAMNGHIIDAAEQEFTHYKLL